MTSTRLAEALLAHEHGWVLTPLHGKAAYLEGWPSLPAPSRGQVAAWANSGNVGLRTGPVSGVVVIDDDTDDQHVAERYDLPPTITVITGRGGHHYYFRWPGCALTGKLADHVDVLGKGRQAVFVGSVHPDTRDPYQWAEGRDPSSVTLASLPRDVLRRIAVRRRLTPSCTRPARAPSTERDLGSAAARVACAPLGSRNVTLNREAFCAGLQVRRGWVSEGEIVAMLEPAALAAGLRPNEVRTTLQSALSASAAAELRSGRVDR